MPVGPNFAKTLDLPSLKVLSLIFDANPGGHPTPHWHTGVLNLLSKFGNQLTALALNPIVLTPSSFQSCLNSLNNERLEFLGLFEKHFPSSKALPSAVENGVGDYFDWPVLIRLTTPGAFPCLKLLEMEVRNMVADNDVSIGGTRLELEVVELIAVRAVKADATGSSAENVGESTFAGEFKRKKGDCTTAGMHIAFTRASNINIVEALEDRGIDLRSRSLQMRLVYPNATISHGSLPVSPWGH
ncbi:hypothetical protein NMY22_g13266 [Coprinellus aureogranulatus]|nr:hypothetical protein NMY22_g13266 [Coprinellus aureogranulatus]